MNETSNWGCSLSVEKPFILHHHFPFMKKIPQDIIGDIAILKFPRKTPWLLKKFKSWRFLKENKNVKTVLEKTEKISGKLRISKTKHLTGVKTKEANYKENNCSFKFNVDEAYFSPRLSHERKKTSEEILKIIKKRKNPKIMVLFSGVGPYPIVLAKEMKKENIKGTIFSNELNKNALEFQKTNIHLNKVENYIKIVPGNANDLPKKIKEKFDVILMPRPNLKETFLSPAIKLSKKGTTILYHGFGKKEEVLKEIKEKIGRKIENTQIRKAGDIGVGSFRWVASLKIK